MGSALVSCWRKKDMCSEPSLMACEPRALNDVSEFSEPSLMACEPRAVNDVSDFSEPSLMACEPRSLNDLSDEILLHILSHLGPEDLCLIAKVSERLNVLAKDKILWKTLSYNCDRSSDINDIEEVLTAAPALHSFILRNCIKDTDMILEFLFQKPLDLKRLILQHCYIGDVSRGLLASIVALNPDLEVLSLEHCRPITLASYCLIARLKKLSELDITYSQGLDGNTVRLIADSCQQLKKLSFERGTLSLDDDDVIHVIDRLGKQLTTLVLVGSGLTDVAYSYLKNCSRLQELGLSWCKEMTDRGLLEGIGSLHELTHLGLKGGENLTAQALSTFLHRPSMTSIVLLDLTDCRKLDDEGLKGIAERCAHLEEFTGYWCRSVTDAGISMVISHCSQLRVLNLNSLHSITGAGWLALVPSHLPHLRQLCLKFCDNICYKYVEKLKAAAPELEVIK